MSSFYVYLYYEPGEDKPFYVGKGSGDRAWAHLNPSRLSRTTHFYNKLRKMLSEGIKPDIRVLKNNLSEAEAFALESRVVAGFGRLDQGTGCLMNHTEGGEGSSDISLETRAKLSAASFGREHSLESRHKISNSWYGPGREARCLRQSQTNTKRYGRPIEQVNLVTGQVIKEYPSQHSVKEFGFCQSNVSAVLAGRTKSSGGYGWRYA